MKDMQSAITALDQRATATITYGVPVSADYAKGTVTVVDYLKAIQQKAVGSITYGTPTAAVKATGSITYGNPVEGVKASQTITYGTPSEGAFSSGSITYGAPEAGDTVVVAGHVFTKVAASPAANQFSSIAELTALIQALSEVNATDNGSTIMIVAATIGTGGDAITLSVDGDNTGTLAVSGATLTGGAHADTVTVDGTTFTCVAATPAANEFSSIANLTALIQALPNVNATDNGTVITVVAAAYGTAGNSIALSVGGENTGDLAVTGGTLTGGVECDTVVVNGNTFKCVTSGAGAGEFTNIAELEALVEAVTGLNSSQDGTTVAIEAAAWGTAANAYTLALGGSNAGTMAVSGATLTGGVNGDTVIVNGNTFTCVTSGAGAGEFTSIAELEALVEAVTGVDSSQNGTVVAITAADYGVAGNAITLALGTNAGTMAISGATLTGGQTNLTVTVNGTALVQGTAFTAETSNAVTATNIAAAIDALENIGAAAEGAVVTIIADARGVAGNAYTTVTSNAAAATVSGATFTGGRAGDTVVIAGTTCTCVASGAGANQFVNIAGLKTLADAITGLDATNTSTVVTIVVAAAGAAGNATTLALGEDNAGTMAISGATFTGGSDYGYSETFSMDGHSTCDIFLSVTTLSGTPTLNVTPEISIDKSTWYAAKDTAGNAIAFAQLVAAGSEFKRLPITGNYVRCKIDLGGTNPIATGTITFVASGN